MSGIFRSEPQLLAGFSGSVGLLPLVAWPGHPLGRVSGRESAALGVELAEVRLHGLDGDDLGLVQLPDGWIMEPGICSRRGRSSSSWSGSSPPLWARGSRRWWRSRQQLTHSCHRRSGRTGLPWSAWKSSLRNCRSVVLRCDPFGSSSADAALPLSRRRGTTLTTTSRCVSSAPTVSRRARAMRVCSVNGCGRKHKAHGYCGTHYQLADSQRGRGLGVPG